MLQRVAVLLSVTGIFLVLPWLTAAPAAQGDVLSKKEIIERLQGPPRTRSLILGGGDTAAQPAEPAGWIPDLRITFPFDSAELTADARGRLDVLGEALLDDRLATGRFEIAGHTDAVGNPSYNQDLSERRAQAARDYLVGQWGIDPERLVPKGFGQAQLFNPVEPEAAENRRVELLRVGG